MTDGSFSGYRTTMKLIILVAILGVLLVGINAFTSRERVTGLITYGEENPEKPITFNVPGLVLVDGGQENTLDLETYIEAAEEPQFMLTQQSSPSTADCSLEGHLVRCAPREIGTNRITVLAMLGTIQQETSFDVIVRPSQNRISLLQPIPPLRIRAGQEELTLDLEPYFYDPTGDPLNFTTNQVAGLYARIEGTLLRIRVTPDWQGDGYYRFTAWKDGKRTDSNLVHAQRVQGTLW